MDNLSDEQLLELHQNLTNLMNNRSIIVKFVINTMYGEFKLSNLASKLYFKLTNNKINKDCIRYDENLIYVIDKLKEKANTEISKLYIDDITVPLGYDIYIEDYHGMENGHLKLTNNKINIPKLNPNADKIYKKLIE